MGRPLCFLDFDGVLNSNQYFLLNPNAKGNENIDPKAVKLFDDFLGQTHALVVIASAWREGRSVQELRGILVSRGFCRPERIVGKTPVLNASRGEEIAAYLKKLAPRLRSKGVRSDMVPIVIFDDDPDTGNLRSYHVQTDPRRGLTSRDLQRGVKILRDQTRIHSELR